MFDFRLIACILENGICSLKTIDTNILQIKTLQISYKMPDCLKVLLLFSSKDNDDCRPRTDETEVK